MNEVIVRPRSWMQPVVEAERTLWRRRATVCAGAVLMLWGLWLWWGARHSGRPVLMSGFGWMVAVCAGIGAARWWAERRALDVRAVARRVEARYPELDGRLLTALEPVGDRKDRVEAYLRERLEGEVRLHWRRNPWQEEYRRRERGWLGAGEAVLGLGLLAVLVMLASVNAPRPGTLKRGGGEAAAAEAVEVLPGDTEVERGAKLVVEARFATSDAREVTLEWLDETGEGVESRWEMRRSLDDPVYGAVVPRVERAGRYRVLHGRGGGAQGRTGDFAVGVFVFPELERVDVTVHPPDYTGDKERELRDVRAVSVLEGSRLGFRLQVNKPVAEAELFGEDGSIVPLRADPAGGTALVAEMRPEKGQRYRVHLVDAEDRANREPPWIQVKVRENQRPRIEMSFPGRDVEVSALQEMAVAGTVWDDVGLERLGVAVTVGEKLQELVLRDRALPGRSKQEWAALFPLEDWGARPADLVSYHVWAEDRGPDGKARRTESELFLAEVRDWEHRFREAPPSGGEGKAGGEGSQSEELRQQQKEIISATWNLTQRIARTGAAGAKQDVGVVRQSQEIVREGTARLLEETGDEGLRRLLSQASGKMEQAAGFLGWVEEQEDAGPLKDALQAERSAYQFLLQAEGRETQVTRSRESQAGGGGESRTQRRLMDLELKQEEDRYETERQAESEAQAKGEQEENLEILRRLKELARRQEAVEERLRELESKLEEAREPREKEDLERQLQRLREEQEELLRDVDQLLEKMDGENSQERLQEERGRVEEAREQVRQAGESMKGRRLADAANAASRAQQAMRELQEDLRQRTANRFAEDLRQMRGLARDLAQRQEEIGGKLDQAPDARNPFEREEAAEARRAMLEQLGEQRERLGGLLERMREVSGQAEASEPALARSLYEGVRRAHAGGADEALEEAQREVRFGAMDEAVEPERAAAKAVEQLKGDVEKAAESVLGSEAEALRQARAELDRLIDSVQKEGGERKTEDEKARAGGKNEPGAATAEQTGKSRKEAGKDLFFEQPEAEPSRGPLTGEGYAAWADGLRRLEDLLEEPGYRAQVARVLDQARQYRGDYRRHDVPPRWELVETGVVRPLAELRDRVTRDLARLEGKDALAPIDRDPVPGAYRELVRQYYEKLARGK